MSSPGLDTRLGVNLSIIREGSEGGGDGSKRMGKDVIKTQVLDWSRGQQTEALRPYLSCCQDMYFINKIYGIQSCPLVYTLFFSCFMCYTSRIE